MQALSKLLAHILAAGGPLVQPARVRWPMHLALREVSLEAGRQGDLHLLDPPLEFRPSPEVGLSAVGVDAAFDELMTLGILRAQGWGRTATIELDPSAAVALRRELMAMSPEKVRLLQRAGDRWAAFASTALKNRSTASRSSASTVLSSTPNRAKLSLPDTA